MVADFFVFFFIGLPPRFSLYHSRLSSPHCGPDSQSLSRSICHSEHSEESTPLYSSRVPCRGELCSPTACIFCIPCHAFLFIAPRRGRCPRCPALPVILSTAKNLIILLYCLHVSLEASNFLSITTKSHQKTLFSTEFLPSFVTLFPQERPSWGRFGGATLAKGRALHSITGYCGRWRKKFCVCGVIKAHCVLLRWRYPAMIRRERPLCRSLRSVLPQNSRYKRAQPD